MCSVAVARRPVEPEVRVQLPAYDLQVLERSSTLIFYEIFDKNLSVVQLPAYDLQVYLKPMED